MTRTVITGIGVVAPNGNDKDRYWSAVREGRSAIQRISHFDPSSYDSQLAGEVRDFEATDFVPKQLTMQTDRWTWFALAAAKMALDDAAYSPADYEPYRTSVVTSSSSGGNEFGQREIQSLWGKGPIFVGAYQSIAWFYAASTGQISIKYGVKGPNGVVVTEGAGGLDALQHARRTIRRGVDAVVCGGTEAPVCPYALVCQMTNGLVSKAASPEDAYRPFDQRGNGYVPGEGGAILIVERLEHAQQRKAPQIYAEIVGYGATQDAYHHSKPEPEGHQFARAITLALREAGIGPPDVDAVFLDAVGTHDWDLAEARALRAAFKEQAGRTPATAPKTMVGRLHSGGAALDVATAALAIRDATIPPTIHLDQPRAGCELNFVVGKPQQKQLNHVLVLARGFGGFNSALVLRRFAA
jgi:minimal PKS chain-length factor (CLF/KS beta)